MMEVDIKGRHYLAATEAEITAPGFEFKEEGTWYLCPGSKRILGEDREKTRAREERTFNFFNHLHLITFRLNNPKYAGHYALDAIKIKCGAEKGWFLKRKDDGRFRLTANPEKHKASTPTDDENFKFTRVETLFAFIPAAWLTAEKPITRSGQAAIENRGI